MLGPLLFIIHLDLNDGGTMNKFAEDHRNWCVVNSMDNYPKLQQDVDQVESWTECWQIDLTLTTAT